MYANMCKVWGQDAPNVLFLRRDDFGTRTLLQISTSRGGTMECFGQLTRWPALAGLIFLCCIFAQAQFTEGTIVGTITDTSGAAVAGAAVRIVNQQTGHVDETKTDDIGYYRVSHLQPGNYQVRVEAKGFKQSVFENVAVNVNTTTRSDAKLQVGGAQEIVEVIGGAPLV